VRWRGRGRHALQRAKRTGTSPWSRRHGGPQWPVQNTDGHPGAPASADFRKPSKRKPIMQASLPRPLLDRVSSSSFSLTMFHVAPGQVGGLHSPGACSSSLFWSRLHLNHWSYFQVRFSDHRRRTSRRSGATIDQTRQIAQPFGAHRMETVRCRPPRRYASAAPALTLRNNLH
jgi:hypothetical protein